MASGSWPFVLEPNMPKALFTAEEFTPTQFSTAQDKAAFGNHFFRFVESGWKQTLFTRTFYNRLSNCFGHIAHYDLHGFYGTRFSDDALRLSFLRHTVRFSCYGDAAHTFRMWSGPSRPSSAIVLSSLSTKLRVAAAIRTRELAQLERLQTKYGVVPTVVSIDCTPAAEIFQAPPSGQPQATQFSLF